MSSRCSSRLNTHPGIQVDRCLQAAGKDGWGEAIMDGCVYVVALGPQLIRDCLHKYTDAKSGRKKGQKTSSYMACSMQNSTNRPHVHKANLQEWQERFKPFQTFHNIWKGDTTPEALREQSTARHIPQAPTTQWLQPTLTICGAEWLWQSIASSGTNSAVCQAR